MLSNVCAWANVTEARLYDTLQLEEEDVKPVIHPVPSTSSKDSIKQLCDKLFALTHETLIFCFSVFSILKQRKSSSPSHTMVMLLAILFKSHACIENWPMDISAPGEPSHVSTKQSCGFGSYKKPEQAKIIAAMEHGKYPLQIKQWSSISSLYMLLWCWYPSESDVSLGQKLPILTYELPLPTSDDLHAKPIFVDWSTNFKGPARLKKSSLQVKAMPIKKAVTSSITVDNSSDEEGGTKAKTADIKKCKTTVYSKDKATFTSRNKHPHTAKPICSIVTNSDSEYQQSSEPEAEDNKDNKDEDTVDGPQYNMHAKSVNNLEKGKEVCSGTCTSSLSLSTHRG